MLEVSVASNVKVNAWARVTALHWLTGSPSSTGQGLRAACQLSQQNRAQRSESRT